MRKRRTQAEIIRKHHPEASQLLSMDALTAEHEGCCPLAIRSVGACAMNKLSLVCMPALRCDVLNVVNALGLLTVYRLTFQRRLAPKL